MISNLWIQIIILFHVILIFYRIITVRFLLKQPAGVILIICSIKYLVQYNFIVF